MSGAGQPPRGRGRPRRVESEADILESARSLLAVHRYNELTLEAIRRNAGVAKTTIYRRWPSKGALIADLVQREIALTEGDAADVLRDLVRLLRGELGPAVVELVGEAQASDETRTLVRGILDPYRSRLASLAGAQAADLLIAAMLLPALIDGTAPDEATVDSAIRLVRL